MGDVALTVPVIKSFVKAYPKAHISVLTNSFFHPFFDGISNLTLPQVDLKGRHKGVLGLRRLVNELNEVDRFDAVIDLHDVLRSRALALFFKIKGISVYRINKGRGEKKAFLKDISQPHLPHTTRRYLQVFKNAGYVFELEKQFITPKEEHLSIEPEKVNVKIGIAPFAAHKSKQWGMTRIISLIEAINKQYEVQYYLFGGGKSEVKQLNRVENNFPNVTNLAGKFNLRQEMHLIADLDVMICMDSGNMHIASLLGIPVISIWGGTHPGVGFSALYQPQENSIQLCEEELKKCKLTVFGSSEKQIDTEPYFCITKINIETVINRLIELEVLQLSTSKF